MAGWRVARGLDRLRDQINEIAPNRSRLSDGSIGDPAHRKQRSDHNPDTLGIVRARDITHDPINGADMHEIAEQLRRARDRRLSYVIWNRRIFSATNQPWTWRPYSGTNPHDKHMHVSVIADARADDPSDWEITMPLTNEDITRISDATAAKVLGRPWTGGRTLVGSTEALIALVQAGARQDQVAAVRADLAAALGRDPVDEAALAEVLWARLPAQGVDVVERVLRGGMTPEDLAELGRRLRT